MPRMIDLIRASAVPSNIVQSAAKGSLSMPAPEMLEILVYLANHNEVFAEQARLTLAGWDEKSSHALAADPAAPKEVLEYLASPDNLRPVLLPDLLGNPAVVDEVLARLAAAAPRDAIDCILTSARVENSPVILKALQTNPNLNGVQADRIRQRLLPEGSEPSHSGSADDDKVLSDEVTAYLTQHADEIAASDKPFQPIGGIHESVLELEDAGPRSTATTASGAAAKPAISKKSQLTVEEQRGSALQKISKLDVKGRIQLAMKGNKEERSILVRDGTKVVALGVLESPKITDGEVEMFAGQKNVLETLLRGISMKRRFMKNYNVVRNLVSNPRTPLDVSLGLMKNLLVNDLKNLSANKDVSDTIRKLALKMYKQKKDPTKKNF